MLKWMVTSARGQGQAEDEVDLAEVRDQEPGVFTISRNNPLYSVTEDVGGHGGHNDGCSPLYCVIEDMEETEVEADTVEGAEYPTLESSHSSGYSSADLSANQRPVSRSRDHARPVSSADLNRRVAG